MTRFARLSALLLVGSLGAAACRRADATGAIERGDALMAQKRYRAAAAEYRAAVNARPADQAARIKLGQALAGSGDVVRAADLLTDDIDVQLKAAAAMLDQARFVDVEAKTQDVLQREPENVTGLVLHATALARLQGTGWALFSLAPKLGDARRFDAARVDLRPRVASEDDRRAESELERARSLAPAEPEPQLALANFYWATNRLDEAEPLLREFADRQTGHAAANHALGAYYLAHGREAEAVTYLSNAAAVPGALGRDARFSLVDYYIARGRTADARALLESMSAQDDDEGEVSTRLAEVDAQAGNPSGAVRRLDATLRRHPTKASALLLRARILFARGNPDPRYARAAVTADPGDGEARQLLGEVLAASGDLEGSLAEYREAVRRDPTEVKPRLALVHALVTLGNGQDALPVARDALRLAPDSKAAALAVVAAAVLTRDYDEAAAALAPLQARFPADPDVATSEGQLLAARGNDAGARAAYLRALAADANALTALDGLVESEVRSKPSADTLHRVESALVAHPGNPGLLLTASRVFSAIGDRARAETALRQAFALDPKSASIGIALATVLRQAGRSDEAVQVLRQVLAKRPPRALDVRATLAAVLEESGRLTEAQAEHEQIVFENPDAADSSLWLASRYLNDPEKLNGALELAMAAKRGRPDDPEVSALLGRIYAEKGLSGLAVSSLKDAINGNPRQALYHFYLAGAYERGGNLSLARDEYAAALRIDPAFPGADKARQMAGNRR